MLHDHVGAFLAREPLHLGHHVRGVMVQGLVGPQPAGLLELRLAACGGDHARAQHLGQLDGRHPHAAARRPDQHVLARAQARPRHQHPPRGEEDEGEGRGLLEAEALGQRDHVGHRAAHELGVAAVDLLAQDGVGAAEAVLASEAHAAPPAGQPGGQHHALARAQSRDRRAQRGDLARDVATEDVGERYPQRGQAGPRPQVEVVQGARPHPHQGLARQGDRIGQVRGLEHLGPAVTVDDDRLHRARLTIIGKLQRDAAQRLQKPERRAKRDSFPRSERGSGGRGARAPQLNG